MGKAFSDEVTACEVDEGFAGGGEGFVIFAESAVVPKPSKRSFDNPAPSLQTKAFSSTARGNLKYDAET